MAQIFHIFQKDCRRHWPEVLVALFLLGAYARLNVNPWEKPAAGAVFLGRFLASPEWLAPVMIFFWLFLVLRITYGESLVGDRQWWVTRPYIWWQLLLSKVLFIVVVICIPLFFIQLYFLYHAGFPVVSHIGSVLNMQLGLLLMGFLGALVLGALTRSVGQAFLVVAGLIAIALTSSWLDSTQEFREMSAPSPPTPFDFSMLWYLVPMIAALLCQYAFRRTWLIRSALLAYLALALLATLAPDHSKIEEAFPLATDTAQIPVRLILQGSELQRVNQWRQSEKYVSLALKARMSVVPSATYTQLYGIKLALTSADGKVWTGGWQSAYQGMWPGETVIPLGYAMKHNDYDFWSKVSARLRLEAAFTQYEESGARDVVLAAGPISDPQLGHCRIPPYEFAPQLQCRSPISSPAFMATVKPNQSTCGERSSHGGVRHAWVLGNRPGLLEPGISPIVNYDIFFRSESGSLPQKEESNGFLCPGTTLRIAEPTEGKRFRIQLEAPEVSIVYSTEAPAWYTIQTPAAH